MKPTEILADANRYLLGIADSLYQLSTQYRIGSADRAFLQKNTEDLMKIQANLQQVHSTWVENQSAKRKAILEEQQQILVAQDTLKKQQADARLKTTCKKCAHYKWVHENKNPNACGSKDSTCGCTEYVARDIKKDKTKE